MKFELYYPVRPFLINQHFGDNVPCVKDFGLSTQDIVNGPDNHTCPIGYTKLYQAFGMAGHNGTDLGAGEQPIYAACAGTVVEKQTVPARGLGLGILTDAAVELNGLGTSYMKVRYWHLKSFSVEVGDHVKAGDIIGVTDNTGYSSGDHLHFEGNPMTLDAGGHANTTYIGDSIVGGIQVIAGAIDIQPYFTGVYADTLHAYVFANNLVFGETSIDIARAQNRLKVEGVFPAGQASTGYYGPITASAVLAFRAKRGISSETDPLGHNIGPLTRAGLNTPL